MLRQEGASALASGPRPLPEKMEDKPAAAEEGSCADCLNKELRLASICPTRERTELFVDSQWTWGRISVTYVIYRLVVAVLVIAWALGDFFDEAGRWYSFNYAIWLVFATNWSLFCLCINCIVMAATTTYYFVRGKCAVYEDKELRVKPIGGGLAAQWVVYNIASNTSIVVSISYWAFVVIIDGSGFLTTSMSQLKHTLNTVYVVLDMFINAIPIRVLHLFYPLSLGIIYAIFNAVYFINDGVGPNGRPYAYYVLDWRNPLGSAITCFLGLILCVIVQILLYGIYRLRLWFHRKLMARINKELEPTVLGSPGDQEDTSIIPKTQATPTYRAMDDLELKTGK